MSIWIAAIRQDNNNNNRKKRQLDCEAYWPALWLQVNLPHQGPAPSHQPKKHIRNPWNPLEDDMFDRNQKISPNYGESLLKWEYYPQYISDDGEFGRSHGSVWYAQTCLFLFLRDLRGLLSFPARNFDDVVAVSRARFQCHGNSESLIKYVCVCVVLEQVLTASHTRLKICSKSSSHERISFLERGPFHLWCFCRRRPKEVLKCFKDITKIKKRKPPSIHATLWPRYLTQMMWSCEKMAGKPNIFHLLSLQRAIYEITQKQASQQSASAETEVNGQELGILPCSWNDLHFVQPTQPGLISSPQSWHKAFLLGQ